MAETLSGTVTVFVLRATNLLNKDSLGQGLSDPYVIISGKTVNGAAGQPHKTKIIDDNLNPVWNEKFFFVVDNVPNLTLNFEVLDKDPLSDDQLGTYTVDITPATVWGKEISCQLKLPAKEKASSAGELVVQFEYSKGEKVAVDNAAAPESKKQGLEALKEMAGAFEDKRMISDILTKHEEEKMALLNKIFTSIFKSDSPFLKTVQEEKLFVIKYQKAAYQVDETHLTEAKWAKMMKKSDGTYFVAAQRIITSILKFQLDKRQRSIRVGYLDDPEGLFCEEFKNWCAEVLCTFDMTKTAMQHVTLRVEYLEEVLLTPTLFDDPSTLGSATIQQVIVNARRLLKYHLLAEIEKELASEDAVRAFDDVKKHCNTLIYNCYEFLAHVFRAEIPGQVTAADKLLKTLQEDDNLKHFMGDSLTEVLDAIKGVKERSEKYSFDLREKGLIPVLNFLDITKLKESDELLPLIFTGPYSGVEGFFQGNPYISYKFLRAHAILLEFGRLFVVIEKARNCAKQGGTLLVYGVANAQLNALLDSTKSMVNAIKDEFTAVCKIAECAFEKLVMDNNATPARSKWIVHFKQVFPCSNKINDAVKMVLEDVGQIKLMANSMTLYERFQKAQNDTNDFLDSADSFSQRTATVLGTEYKKPKISKEDLQKNLIDNTDALMQNIQKGQGGGV